MCTRAATLLLLSLWASPTAAQDVHSVRLSWERADGAESCEDGDAVRRGVEARLGREVFVEFGEPADARVRGRVARGEERGFVATLELDDGEGAPRVRTVPSASEECEALYRTVVLLVSMFIDPETALTAEERAATEPPEEDPPEEPAEVVPEEPVAPEPPEPPVEDVEQERWGARLWIGGGAWAGPGPTITGGPELGVALVPPGGLPSVELALAYGVASEASQAASAVAVSLGFATLSACPRFYGDDVFAFDGCGDVQTGFLLAEASGPADASAQVRPWLALGARLRAVLRFAPGFAGLAVGAHVPLWRDRFGFTGPGGFVPVHEAFAVSGTASLVVGLEI